MESYLIFWGLCAVVCLAIAPMKGRPGAPWAGLGFLFGPLAVLAILVMPKTDETKAKDQLRRGQLTLCPFCKEAIKPDAVKCKHCHSDLSKSATPEPNERTAHAQLQDAIYNHDLGTVKAFLESGLDLSANPLPFSHAEYAQIHGNKEIIELFEKR